MRKEHGRVHVEGEEIDHDERQLSHSGNSDHITIPKHWLKKYLKQTIWEISLIRDSEGELCIVASKPRAEPVQA